MMMLPLIAGMGMYYLAHKKGLWKARSEMTSMERKEADRTHRIAVDQTVILALGEKIDSLQNAVDFADESIRMRDETHDKQLKKEREATEEARKQCTRLIEEATRLKAQLQTVEKKNAELGIENKDLRDYADKLEQTAKRRGGRRAPKAARAFS